MRPEREAGPGHAARRHRAQRPVRQVGHAVRFWEKEFDILNPHKNKKGNRLFTPKDIKNIQIIYHLLKERGFTVEGAKKKLKENKTDTIDNIEIVTHLKEIRGFLVNLREEL